MVNLEMSITHLAVEHGINSSWSMDLIPRELMGKHFLTLRSIRSHLLTVVIVNNSLFIVHSALVNVNIQLLI